MSDDSSYQPFRNAPADEFLVESQPARPSNARAMRSYNGPLERYSMGLMVPNTDDGTHTPYAKAASVIQHVMSKLSENEPEADKHENAPDQVLRPRAELILFDRDGVFCIDKGEYLAFPGGGIADGEQPRDAAVREALEEASRNVINMNGAGMVEAVWPEDFKGSHADGGFDGERSYFFLGVDGGDAGMSHDDAGEFVSMPFDVVADRLQLLVEEAGEQAWAKRQNVERLKLVRRAKQMSKVRSNLQPQKQAQAQGVPLPTQMNPDPNAEFVDQQAQQLQGGQPQQPAPGAPPAPAAPQQPPVPAPPQAAGAQSPMNTTMGPAPGGPTAPGGTTAPKLAEDKIPGGLADTDWGAKLLRMRKTKDPEGYQKEFWKGLGIEKEHTSDDSIAEEIAEDHLVEDPKYYDKLEKLEKEADAATVRPLKQYLMFTPDGRVVVRRMGDRRFGLPTEGRGRPAPYEDPVRFFPQEGVPEEGYHGYEIGLNVGDAPEQLPEGFEALPGDAVLRDLYASMGLAKNKQFRQIDRSRSRAILRHLKRKKEREAPAPAASPATIAPVAPTFAPPPTPEVQGGLA